MYVTFNYNLMLERGPRPFVEFGNFADYVKGPTKLVKAHGSVDWGKGVEMQSALAPGGDYRERLVRDASVLVEKADGWYRLRHYDISVPLGTRRPHHLVAYPALALPTRGKGAFTCPDDHVVALQHAIQSMEKLLVIGWRAQEVHILLKAAPRTVQAHVVTSNYDHAMETAQLLRATIPGLSGFAPIGDGFSGYVRESGIDSLLD